MQTDEADVTTHSSAASGAFREFILTLIDAGTIEFDINYVPTDSVHIGIRNDFLGRASATGKWSSLEPCRPFRSRATSKQHRWIFQWITPSR